MLIMEPKEIQDVISKFSGKLEATFYLTQDIYKHLGFDLDINFDSSNSLQRFTNMVRNMIGKGLVKKPIKLGRTLIFDERSYLELIVARKYIAAGISMDALSGYLADKTTKEVYERLFAKQLPDIDKLSKKSLVSTQKTRSESSISGSGEPNPRLYHHVKVDTGLFLLAKAGEYEELEVMEMVVLLKNHLKERAKRQQEEGGATTDDDSNPYEKFA